MSWRSLFPSVVLACLVSVAPLGAATESDLAILTYPVGVVTGEIPVTVDLGPTGAPAKLFLDGDPVCSMTSANTSCTVDVGADPRVHLLELIRRGASGRPAEVARRWINRPGQEAELTVHFGAAGEAGVCAGSVGWAHPDKMNPVVLQVSDNGRPVELAEATPTFRVACPDPNVPHVIAAAAIFPDGRRAETVVLSGGYGGQSEASLTAVPVTWAGDGEGSCDKVKSALGGVAQAVQRAGYEVVFVLDPSAGYQTLMKTGWHGSALPSTTSTTKTFDSLVLQGSKGDEPTPKNSWKRAEASLIGADRLWFVAPDLRLSRVNGYGSGRPNWFRLLFQFGSTKIEGKPRLADAVAASGLVAAAGPRPRAVVLILGSKTERDDSQFTPEQARSFLAEVGVPLVVLRNGRGSDDGWPVGVPMHNMEAMADALEAVKARLETQCVAWFTGAIHPNRVAEMLPDDVAIAGRLGDAPANVEAVWRQAEREMAAADGEIARAATGGQVEVTAVTLLVAAKDSEGRPVTDLEPGDLVVREDGRQVTVLGVAPAVTAPSTVAESGPGTGAATSSPPPADEVTELPVTIYIDRKLSGSNEIGPTVRALAERSEWLASIGPVDIVVADRTVEPLLTGSSDPVEIGAELDEIASQASGRHAVETVRTRFLRDMRKIPNRFPKKEKDEEAGFDPNRQLIDALEQGQRLQEFERSIALTAARSAIAEEDSILRLTQERIQDWALGSPVPRPRLMLVVGAGFDQDPLEFYLPFIEQLETQNASSAREEFRRYRQSERISGVGREMAAAGWLVMAVATSSTGSQTTSAEFNGGNRFQTFMAMAPESIRNLEADWLLLDPISTQRRLAAPSGGDVVKGGSGLDDLADLSRGWYRVSYQVDRAPDGALHGLEVATERPGVTLDSPEVVATETGEGQAALRVRRLLRDPSTASSELPVSVEIGSPQKAEEKRLAADATITVDLGELLSFLSDDSRRIVRVSLAVDTGAGEPFVFHRMAQIEGDAPGWHYTVPLEWPQEATATAVVVEDLASGLWGGTVHDLSKP